MKKLRSKILCRLFAALTTIGLLPAVAFTTSVSAASPTNHILVAHGCGSGASTSYDKFTLNGANKAEIKGFGGKSADDVSVKLTNTSENNVSPYWQPTWSTANHPITTDTENLYVNSFNIYPVSGVSNVMISANGSAWMTDWVLGDALIPGRWNRVVSVFDRSASEYGTHTVYINGKQHGKVFPLTEALLGKFSNSNGTAVYRNVITLASGGEAYVDDSIVWKVPKAAAPYIGLPEFKGEMVFGDVVAPGTTSAQLLEAAVSTAGASEFTVKAYRGGDMTIEPLENNAPLMESDTVLLEELIFSGNNAPPDKMRTVYNYYRVSEDANQLLCDMISSNKSYAVRGTLSKLADGTCGKLPAEKVWRLSANSAALSESSPNSYLQSDSAFLASGEWPIVFECDILPEAHVKGVCFSTGGGRNLTSVYPGNNPMRTEYAGSDTTQAKTPGFVHGRWSKLKAVVDYKNKLATTYLDGVKVGELAISDNDANFQNFKKEVRLLAYWDNAEVTEASEKKICLDNYRIYEQMNPKVEKEAIVPIGISQTYLQRGEEISFFGGKITDEVKTELKVSLARAFESENSYNVVADGENIPDNGLVMLQNAAGSYAYYTVRERLLAIAGNGYVNDGMYTDGGLSLAATGGTIVLAQYNREGSLLKAQVHTAGVDSPAELEQVEGTVSVKAMLWEDMQTLSPCVKSMELTYNPNYEEATLKILMVGNSFAEDMSCYLKDIAAQNGKDITIGILNKGGASAAWHAERMEAADPQAEGIGFTYNGKTTSFINLKTALSAYDWDIVTLQNWSLAGWNYDGTDDAYDTDWKTPFTTLANYIKENEPGAKIMLHETWAYEQGYNNTVHSTMSEKNHTLYNRAAEDLQTVLGYKPGIINSCGVFDAAIAYEKNGVQLFNTAYDAGKHQFAGGEEYSVQNGSCLLSDEDEAAGKITLHRDGFHASHAGRYLLAANAYVTLFNQPVSGNSFCPGAARYAVGAVDLTSGSAAFLNYNALDKEVVATLQKIADAFHEVIS